MKLQRMKRLPGGGFGEMEEVFSNEGGAETDIDKMTRLESENALLAFSVVEKDVQISNIETSYAQLVSQLKEKGVL